MNMVLSHLLNHISSNSLRTTTPISKRQLREEGVPFTQWPLCAHVTGSHPPREIKWTVTMIKLALNPQRRINKSTWEIQLLVVIIILCFSELETCHKFSGLLSVYIAKALKQNARNSFFFFRNSWYLPNTYSFWILYKWALDSSYKLIRAHDVIKCLIRSKN